MRNLRRYGRNPYNVVLVHGGPGAAGGMAPIGREISDIAGILEPFQTRMTISGLVDELHGAITARANAPVTLIGHSWGSWLSMIFASQHTNIVNKVILIGSGAFEESYAKGIMDTRLGRLDGSEKAELLRLNEELDNAGPERRSELMSAFGRLMSKADSYAPTDGEDEDMICDYDIYENIWREAERMRRDGTLMRMAGLVKCPVVAIHGDHDPHDPDGVRIPLSKSVENFRFILLERCGHEPWHERYAREPFYDALRSELFR
ncbi:MAG TPA: alpha/beta hydrolase [Candidatus Methanofastidiosa archaeon]|nr:alpha/beta hydrolase [Candidatus Methanofastidiosa archaeon]HPR41006.1 alpha/beta hydrolase [Candidatus Methanofastidiosa archaeon]